MWNSEEKDLFMKVLLQFKPELTALQNESLLKYAAFVVEENQKVNLTAITKPEEFAIKHIVDSLLVLDYVDVDSNELVDVGTGAGMPGLIWACVRRNTKYLLLDSLNKRVAFLERAISLLNLTNVKALHYRAEDAGKDKEHREKYQIATARAVASLPVLLEYCLPFVAVGGQFIALKGPGIEKEIEESKTALKILGARIENLINYDLPQEMGSRSLVIVKKIAKCPNKYPRKAGVPSKLPL